MLYGKKKKKTKKNKNNTQISISSLPVQYGTRTKYVRVVQMAIQDIHFFQFRKFFLKQTEKTSLCFSNLYEHLLSALTEFTVRQNTPSNDQNFKIRLLLLQQNKCLLSYKRVNP